MFDVRMNKNTIVVYRFTYIPVAWDTIEGKDGQEYKVRRKGTGQKQYKEKYEFEKPVNGNGLPDSMKEKFSEDEQNIILKRVLKGSQSRMRTVLEKLTEYLDEFNLGIDLIDNHSREATLFLESFTEAQKKVKRTKWKKQPKLKEVTQ